MNSWLQTAGVAIVALTTAAFVSYVMKKQSNKSQKTYLKMKKKAIK